MQLGVYADLGYEAIMETFTRWAHCYNATFQLRRNCINGFTPSIDNNGGSYDDKDHPKEGKVDWHDSMHSSIV